MRERGDRETEKTQAPEALEEELVWGHTNWMKSALQFLLDSLAKEGTCYIRVNVKTTCIVPAGWKHQVQQVIIWNKETRHLGCKPAPIGGQNFTFKICSGD